MISFVLASILLIAAASPANPPQGPQTPQISTQNKSNGSLEDQQHPKPNPRESDSIAKPDKGNPGEHADQGEEKGSEFFHLAGFKVKITDGLLVLFTGILAVFTGLLWKSTRGLWQAATDQSRDLKKAIYSIDILASSTEELASSTEKTAKRQLRAYLSVRVDHQQWHGGAFGSDGRIIFTIKNAGQTPAKEVTADAIYDILPWPLPDHESLLSRLQRTEDSKAVIHPDQDRKGYAVRARELHPLEYERTAEDRSIRLHIFGRIFYRDIFNEEHQTTFCVTIGGRNVARLCGIPTPGAGPIDVGHVDCPCNNGAD